MTRLRPTVAVVDLAAIRHNASALKPSTAELMAVVKADGYGHGDLPAARTALASGAAWLGVALVEEGIRLREAGIDAPILVLSEFPPGSEKEALTAALTPTIYTELGLARLSEAAASTGARPGVHLKVDTGMHRVGVAPEHAEDLIERLARAGLDLEGVWTHFAVAEDPEDPFTGSQLQLLLDLRGRLEARGVRPRYFHAANSGATIARPDSHLDLVRVGVALYGLVPGPKLSGMADLRPAMSWRSAVSLVKRVRSGEAVSYGLHYRLSKEATIATVPVGYADGYRRAFSDGGEVLIRGRRYPVAGTVTMDQITVDCGDEPVEAGDEVVLMGRQGSEEITADELASWAGTINYEIVCGIGDRVPREYVGE